MCQKLSFDYGMIFCLKDNFLCHQVRYFFFNFYKDFRTGLYEVEIACTISSLIEIKEIKLV